MVASNSRNAVATSASVAVIAIGSDPSEPPASLPTFRARIVPKASTAQWRGRAVAAFAGIGRPGKFFQTLESLGSNLHFAEGFPDHHPYREADLARLARDAGEADLITTEKDHERLPPAWRARVETLPVCLAFDEPERLKAWLQDRLPAP